MANDEAKTLPLFERLRIHRGFPMKPILTLRDAAQLFSVSKRTLQDWIQKGKLVPRDLPGRGRFLPEDLERFLQDSLRTRDEETGKKDE